MCLFKSEPPRRYERSWDEPPRHRSYYTGHPGIGDARIATVPAESFRRSSRTSRELVAYEPSPRVSRDVVVREPRRSAPAVERIEYRRTDYR